MAWYVAASPGPMVMAGAGSSTWPTVRSSKNGPVGCFTGVSMPSPGVGNHILTCCYRVVIVERYACCFDPSLGEIDRFSNNH